MVPINTNAQVSITSVDPGIVVLPFHDGFTTSLSAKFVMNSLITSVSTNYDWSLSNAELSDINRELKAIEDQTSNQIVVLMVSSLEGYPLDMFANEIADQLLNPANLEK